MGKRYGQRLDGCPDGLGSHCLSNASAFGLADEGPDSTGQKGWT